MSKVKGIVIHMKTVKMALHVAQIIVQILLGLNLEWIVVVAVI